jgi:low affinity Fe/Cu permease
MNFNKFSQGLANLAGKPGTFMAAAVAIVIWACTGPWFHYNDTWQLIVNTSTTIITFLMVFVIQHTQNRDNDVLHIKIDELLRVTREAQNSVMNLDDLDSKELRVIRKKYKNIGSQGSVEVSAETTTLQSAGNEEPDLAKAAEELKSDLR